MSYADWKNKTTDFKKIDVRGIQGNFFQGIKKHAINTEVGNGLEIVQSFDPIPLYDVMDIERGRSHPHAYGYSCRDENRHKGNLHRNIYQEKYYE